MNHPVDATPDASSAGVVMDMVAEAGAGVHADVVPQPQPRVGVLPNTYDKYITAQKQYDMFTCDMCYDDVKDYIAVLPCDHVMHTDCLIRKMTSDKKYKTHCPICSISYSQSIREHEVRKKYGVDSPHMTFLNWLRHPEDTPMPKVTKEVLEFVGVDQLYERMDTMFKVEQFEKFNQLWRIILDLGVNIVEGGKRSFCYYLYNKLTAESTAQIGKSKPLLFEMYELLVETMNVALLVPTFMDSEGYHIVYTFLRFGREFDTMNISCDDADFPKHLMTNIKDIYNQILPLSDRYMYAISTTYIFFSMVNVFKFTDTQMLIKVIASINDHTSFRTHVFVNVNDRIRNQKIIAYAMKHDPVLTDYIMTSPMFVGAMQHLVLATILELIDEMDTSDVFFNQYAYNIIQSYQSSNLTPNTDVATSLVVIERLLTKFIPMLYEKDDTYLFFADLLYRCRKVLGKSSEPTEPATTTTAPAPVTNDAQPTGTRGSTRVGGEYEPVFHTMRHQPRYDMTVPELPPAPAPKPIEPAPVKTVVPTYDGTFADFVKWTNAMRHFNMQNYRTYDNYRQKFDKIHTNIKTFLSLGRIGDTYEHKNVYHFINGLYFCKEYAACIQSNPEYIRDPYRFHKLQQKGNARA